MSLAGLVRDVVTHHRDHSSTSPENVEPGASLHHSGLSSSPKRGHDKDVVTLEANGGPMVSEYTSVGDTSDYVHPDTQSHDSQGQGFNHRPHYKSPPDTPATRTGPPRSLSFAYSRSFSNSPSRHNSGHQIEPNDLRPTFPYDNADVSLSPTNAEFRGVLESLSSRDQVSADRKGKRRESRSADEGWTINPIRWFHESPRDEHPRSAIPWTSPEPESVQKAGENATVQETNDNLHREGSQRPNNKLKSPARRLTDDGNHSGSVPQPRKGLRRALSLPHTPFENKTGKAKWARLRSLLPNLPNLAHDQGNADLVGPSVAVASPTVNITDELITGGLATLMLRLWFERDEKGHRRVPILLHRLRIRISDSYHPTEEKRTAFRIECEYANGAARWVIYRQLRDFFSLHTHYAVSNVYNRLGDELPEFPLTSEYLSYESDEFLIIRNRYPVL